MTTKKKIIGILGGMGPESTAIFYQEIIKQCQKQYGAKYDKDYPEIFIYNLPIPDVVEGFEAPSKTLAILIKGAQKLKSIWVDFIVIPCNSVAYFLEDIRKEVSIPILNIIEETAKKVKLKRYRKVGLLATETAVKNKIYNKYFNRYKIELLIPEKEDQNKITGIIRNILAGKKIEKDKDMLKQIIEKLKNKGAEAIVLGCTDIPILLKQKDVDIEIFDAVKIYAESTIKYAIGD